MASTIDRLRSLLTKVGTQTVDLLDDGKVNGSNQVAQMPAVAPPSAKQDGFEKSTGSGNKLQGSAAANTHVPTRESTGTDYVVVSSNDDDPFSRPNNYEHLLKEDFTLDEKGRPTGLVGPRVKIVREDVIYRQNEQNRFVEFSNNPWQDAKPNSNGNFTYRGEPRFPSHPVVRGPDGKAVLDAKGLQQWGPRELYSGQTIAFESVNTVSRSMEGWAGRKIAWGNGGQMEVQTHAFVGFNAFFSPAARGLFFGVVPYRLPGETEIKMFEVASSWEIAAHEAGHALHNDLKPNRGLVDEGYRQWGESFGDQLAMWSSLQDPDRVKALLRETRGDINRSNSVTSMAEVFASLVGEGTGMRDAFQQKTVSSTSDEFHDRSEVLTGASYKIFQRVYQDKLAGGLSKEQAILESANVMGTFMAKTTEHTPENTMTLEDVAKAYLSVDKEYFGGRYQSVLVAELERREIFRKTAVPDPKNPGAPLPPSSFEEWKAAQLALPILSIDDSTDPKEIEAQLQAHADALGLPPEFGLKLQSRTVNADGHQVIRVEMTRGRGADAEPLANHGVLVFRKDGSLADLQTAWPRGLDSATALKLLDEAKTAKLNEKGKLGFVRNEEGAWTVQAVVPITSQGANRLDSKHRVYSLENPGGVDVLPHVHGAGCGHFEKLKGLLPSGAEVLDSF